MTATAQTDTVKSERLKDVVVTGTRNATTTRNLPMTVSVVDHATLTEKQQPNILTTLNEQVPGMFVTQRAMMGFGVSSVGTGSVNIRGINSGIGQVLVLIDGNPQYQGVYGHGVGDSYQTMTAERVEVLRGPASVLYGSNAMGGVINIITRGAQSDGIRTQVNLGAGSYGTFQAEANNQIRSGKFSSTVAAQYGRSDNHRPRMGFEQYGAYAKFGYDLSKNWNAFADFNFTHFNASSPGSTTSPLYEADQWITRAAATIAIENHYEKTNGRISVYDNFGFHRINDGYNAENPTAKPKTEHFRSKDAVAGISWYQSINLIPSNSITVGLDYQHIYGRAYYTDIATGAVVTDKNNRGIQSGHAHSNEIAGYVDVRQDLTSWLTVDAGVRYDHHSVAGGEFVPQAGVVVKPSSNGELKALVSKGFRNPTTKEMYIYGSANSDSLHAERMWNYELAWKQRLFNGAFTYGANIFIIDADNIIQTVPFGKRNVNMNTGKINNRGAELEATWRASKHISLSTNHSFLHMHNHIVAAPEYKGYLGANIHYGKWSGVLGVQQLCGLYTTVGANENKDDVTLVNAIINYQPIKQLKLWVRGDNLLAQKYELFAGYPMPRATFMSGVNITF